MRKILFIFGTRPEAIKLSPVVRHMRTLDGFEVRVCVTAQHRFLLDQVLEAFEIVPDHDLNLMLPGQTLFQSTSRILGGLESVLEVERPDMIVVQGDTTTTLCGALAGFYRDVPVAHVEAGLRTGDIRQPFPEEMNRVLTTRLTSLHFPPTKTSAGNLLADGVAPEAITITGNTGIDAVLYVRQGLENGSLEGCGFTQLNPAKKLIVVTAHRRESFGDGFERICAALSRIAGRQDVEIVYPVHPNPNVRKPVEKYLSNRSNIYLVDPLAYVPFVDLMCRAHILLTDSGGIQEEASSLGKPVLVLREKTERPEALEAGTTVLVGTGEERILREVFRLLDEPQTYLGRTRVHNPYGDGRSSERICAAIRSFLSKNLRYRTLK